MSKIRLDFVTNSSSTSYTVIMKSLYLNKPPKIIFDEYPLVEWVYSVVDNIFSSIEKDKITNKEDLTKYFLDIYGYNDMSIEDLLEEDEYVKNRYGSLLKRLEEGFVVYNIDVNYSEDDKLGGIIEALHDGENCIVEH